MHREVGDAGGAAQQPPVADTAGRKRVVVQGKGALPGGGDIGAGPQRAGGGSGRTFSADRTVCVKALPAKPPGVSVLGRCLLATTVSEGKEKTNTS